MAHPISTRRPVGLKFAGPSGWWCWAWSVSGDRCLGLIQLRSDIERLISDDLGERPGDR